MLQKAVPSNGEYLSPNQFPKEIVMQRNPDHTKLVQYNGEYFKYSCHEFYFKNIETRKNTYAERRLTCILFYFYLCPLLHSLSTQKWVQGKTCVLLGKEEGGQVY